MEYLKKSFDVERFKEGEKLFRFYTEISDYEIFAVIFNSFGSVVDNLVYFDSNTNAVSLNHPNQVKRPKEDTTPLKVSFCCFWQGSDVAYVRRIWYVEYEYLHHTFPGITEMRINLRRAFGWERLENPTSTIMGRRQRLRNLQHNNLDQRRWKFQISASIRDIWALHEAWKQPNLGEILVKMSQAKQHTTGVTRRWSSLQLVGSGDNAQGQTGVRIRLGKMLPPKETH